MAQPAWHQDSCTGWLRVSPRQILTTWEAYRDMYDGGSSRFCLEHKEVPERLGQHIILPGNTDLRLRT